MNANTAKEAVDEKLNHDQLEDILDAMDAEHGKPEKAARTWAKRVLTAKQ